eukprot:CAMPEP_0197024332 /NCGR_PEP_ID=MMETSP1384-20130603/4898_1 /TAXON_ID=29189 /ORGANISM="Ammonia sp." /LENGTH=254 /DNA_ID=CAMNT_0042452697 /DNA_START=9 /DNA_END=770 /DNA_ORIENTATION=-
MAQCTICLDPLLTDLLAAKCGHVFHDHCINQWIHSTKKSCPNCNKKLTKSSLFKLFLSSLSDDDSVKVLQREIEELHRKLSTYEHKMTQLGETVRAIHEQLEHQQTISQSYIQKNIELDEQCDELREQIEEKEQQIAKLTQNVQTSQHRQRHCNAHKQTNSRKRKRNAQQIDLSLSSDEDNDDNDLADIQGVNHNNHRNSDEESNGEEEENEEEDEEEEEEASDDEDGDGDEEQSEDENEEDDEDEDDDVHENT